MDKAITPVFEAKGKRRKLVGFQAVVGGYTLPYLFDTEREASEAADEYADRQLAHGNA